ncbi:MAG TPA: Ig-like domain-containing protein, partial [Phycisphaerales bacterium]|nr:Ig-like domain-containing protein [Phycisphaerales bacterium]
MLKTMTRGIARALSAFGVLLAASSAPGQSIIYNQTNNNQIEGVAAASTDVTNRPHLWCEAADDFCLNATITRVTVSGYMSGSSSAYTGIHLRFYAQGPGGKPGEELKHYFFPSGDSRWARLGTQQVINIAHDPFIASGRHLMSVQLVSTQQSGQGTEWSWYGNGSLTLNGQPFWWRNPPGGWGSGNLDWSVVGNKDLSFALWGTLNGGTPDCTILAADPPSTVRWNPSNGPHHVEDVYEVPAGDTLILEPGTVVTLGPQARFRVSGTLLSQGTAAQRVSIQAQANTSQLFTAGGSIEAVFTDFNTQLGANVGGFNNSGMEPGTAVFTDCTFGEYAWFHLYTSFVEMERCTFTTTYGPIISSSARLKDVTSNQTIQLHSGIYVLDNVTVQGAQGPSELDGAGFNIQAGIQGAWIKGIRALNNRWAGLYNAGGNMLIDGPGNVLQGNAVALELGGGLLAGSVLPPTGNTVNGVISVGYATRPQFGAASQSPIFWDDIGLPYYVGDNWTVVPSGTTLTLRRGVSVRLGFDAQLATDVFGLLFVEGRPGAPVTLSAIDPARPWHSLAYGLPGCRITDCDLSGSQRGAATFLGVHVDMLNSRIHHNEHGAVRGVRARKTVFEHNTAAGVSNTGSTLQSATPDAWGGTNPNIFRNNLVGVADYFHGAYGQINAEHNWWNSPTGPTATTNPGGAGDAALGFVDFTPFRTEPPDESDHPPVVELAPVDYVEPLKKVTLHWTASDDRRIVRQRVAYRLGTDGDRGFTVVQELPAHQRAYEWTPPEVGFNNIGPDTYIRIIATDDAGQDGYSQIRAFIPDQVRPGFVDVTTTSGHEPFAGRTFRPQQILPVAFSFGNFDEFTNGAGGPDVFLELLNDGVVKFVSATYQAGEPLSEIRIPGVSTDQARLVMIKAGTYNRAKIFFSDTFAIRPDQRLGDAPPTVAITAPAPGSVLAGGSTVPVSWTAADDDFVRSARVHVSYDAGRTWVRVAEGLPGPTGTFNLTVAPGTGYEDVRIRVIAVDSRFQNSSHTIPVSIAPGQLPPPPADCPADLGSAGGLAAPDGA